MPFSRLVGIGSALPKKLLTNKDLEKGQKRKIGAFQWKKELERRKEEKRLREEAEKQEELAKQEAEEAGVEAPPMQAPEPVVKKQTVTRTESGTSAHMRTRWTFKVLDFNKVPRAYLVLDEKKVRAAIQAGIHNIDGLEVFEEPVTVLRT